MDRIKVERLTASLAVVLLFFLTIGGILFFADLLCAKYDMNEIRAKSADETAEVRILLKMGGESYTAG